MSKDTFETYLADMKDYEMAARMTDDDEEEE